MEPLINPHWEALTPTTREAFERVNEFKLMPRFYLAGGTGLALHLGHRFSVDLDLFSQDADAVGPDERALLREHLEDPSLTFIHDKDASFVATWHGVGVSFFRLPQYPLVQEPLLVKNISLATIAEIGAMKLAAIIDRGTRKDLVDLYFVLQNAPLETVFQVASVKYARVRSFPVSATRALAYFTDAEAFPMPHMIDRTAWSKMRRFLERQAVEVGRKQLADLWE